MRKRISIAVAAIAALAAFAGTAAAYELTIPAFVYRTGPYAPSGIPAANGYRDYFHMLNERDGGINGARVNYIECEFGYNTKVGLECYESLKNEGESGSLVVQPLSTGLTYQLIPKAAVDEIPIFSMGYGRTAATNGRVFPWVFNFPATYWDQASVFVKYIGEREGGMDQLAGKKIALVHHNSAYGKEPIPTLEALSGKHGFELILLAVDHPGQEQKSTWLTVRRERPDWLLLWGWGVMNQVAVKEAVSIRYPMDRFIGNWWSGSENDVRPSGAEAHGYLAGGFHRPDADTKLHADVLETLYDGDYEAARKSNKFGEVLYNRGLIAAVWTTEAIRTAMAIHDTVEIRGKHMRDGLEALDVDDARLEELGLGGFAPPIKITCDNHTGPGEVLIQQWDAHADSWRTVSGFYTPDRDVIEPLVAADSAKFAEEQGITPRTDC